MRISDEALDEFIAIYKEEFMEEISLTEAKQMASGLLMLYGRLSRKLPSIDPTRPSDGHPQIGDFGLARAYGVPVNTYSNEVCTFKAGWTAFSTF